MFCAWSNIDYSYLHLMPDMFRHNLTPTLQVFPRHSAENSFFSLFILDLFCVVNICYFFEFI